MTEYWEEQMGIPELTEARRAGMAEGYREGVSDGLKLALRMCEALRATYLDSSLAFEEGCAECSEAIRALIPPAPEG